MLIGWFTVFDITPVHAYQLYEVSPKTSQSSISLFLLSVFYNVSLLIGWTQIEKTENL